MRSTISEIDRTSVETQNELDKNNSKEKRKLYTCIKNGDANKREGSQIVDCVSKKYCSDKMPFGHVIFCKQSLR